MVPVKKGTSSKKGAAGSEKASPNDYWQRKLELDRQGIKLFSQTIYEKWCKSCGICVALCPKNVYEKDERGGPEIARPDDCIGCRVCELHCPDFAMSISERYPDRRGQRRHD
ncbi:MAG: hypothetical protein C0613_12395 [Desulfobulbaceae bacterium]|nr:MAG: hypothetical protein C0613_12395 [Desulfobulbaceae bacterium]